MANDFKEWAPGLPKGYDTHPDEKFGKHRDLEQKLERVWQKIEAFDNAMKDPDSPLAVHAGLALLEYRSVDFRVDGIHRQTLYTKGLTSCVFGHYENNGLPVHYFFTSDGRFLQNGLMSPVSELLLLFEDDEYEGVLCLGDTQKLLRAAEQSRAQSYVGLARKLIPDDKMVSPFSLPLDLKPLPRGIYKPGTSA